jgi:hypothetical protein
MCHGESKIPNPVEGADHVNVEKYVTNLVSTAVANAVSSRKTKNPFVSVGGEDVCNNGCGWHITDDSIL